MKKLSLGRLLALLAFVVVAAIITIVAVVRSSTDLRIDPGFTAVGTCSWRTHRDLTLSSGVIIPMGAQFSTETVQFQSTVIFTPETGLTVDTATLRQSATRLACLPEPGPFPEDGTCRIKLREDLNLENPLLFIPQDQVVEARLSAGSTDPVIEGQTIILIFGQNEYLVPTPRFDIVTGCRPTADSSNE